MGIDETDQKELESFNGPPIQHSFADRYGMNEKQVKEAGATYIVKHVEELRGFYTKDKSLKI